ncbi:MAG: AMP-binding protein, partial [Pseudomonadota bacterium]
MEVEDPDLGERIHEALREGESRRDELREGILSCVARELRVMMSSVVSAAYALLLHLYCDRDDLVFGSTVAGRPPELPGVENMVGLFINTLPLRVKLSPDDSVGDFVAAVHARQVALRSREQSSATLAQQQSGVEAGTPLYESILVYESFPSAPDHTDGPACHIDRFVEFSHFPLAVLAVPDERFQLMAISDPARIDRTALDALLDNLCHILRTLPQARSTTLSTFDALAPPQYDRAVNAFNDTAQATAPPTTLWAQCIARAEQTPDAVALCDPARSITYGEFARQTAQVSSTLTASGVQAEDVVLVLGPRDVTTVTAVFGVLGAGAAYCPVAEDSTTARLTALVGELERDGRRVFALATEAAHTRLPDSVTGLALTWHDHPTAPAPAGPSLDGTAYVMFTSGSTGTPKGVVVSH